MIGAPGAQLALDIFSLVLILIFEMLVVLLALDSASEFYGIQSDQELI
jgi:hypothetical protein